MPISSKIVVAGEFLQKKSVWIKDVMGKKQVDVLISCLMLIRNC